MPAGKQSNRDGFIKSVRDALSRRAGYRCSNPNCRILTAGPGDGADGTIDIGVAAHITAAAKGGKRFDPNLTKEERSSIGNGIWLCQIHAKLVDDAPDRFPVELLLEWKRISEMAARLEIEDLDKNGAEKLISDIEAIKVYAAAFDRSVFKDEFRIEMSMSSFAQAIRDTVIALSTGIVRDRDQNIIARSVGRLVLENLEWREKIGAVIDLLNAIANRFEVAVSVGDIEIFGKGGEIETYYIKDHELSVWMDSTRRQILDLFSRVMSEAGLDPLPFSGFRSRRW